MLYTNSFKCIFFNFIKIKIGNINLPFNKVLKLAAYNLTAPSLKNAKKVIYVKETNL